MKIDYKDHYDRAYFTCQKDYKCPDGSTKKYTGPSLTWDGFDLVADALMLALPTDDERPRVLLDIGCSSGDLAARLMTKGNYVCYGVDVSQYAVDHAVAPMRGRLACADITTCPVELSTPPYHGGIIPPHYDYVIACDLLEHIYEEDLDKTFAWIIERASKRLFFCVATAGISGQEFVLPKDAIVPRAYEAIAVSGHVNVRRVSYWLMKFSAFNLKVRWDLMYLFQTCRESTELRGTPGWALTNTFVLDKR